MPLFWLPRREAERNWSRQSIPDVLKIQYMLHSKRRTLSSVHVFAYLYTRSLRLKWMFSSTCLNFSLLCYLSFKALLFWVLIFFFSLLPAFHTFRLCFSFPVSVFLINCQMLQWTTTLSPIKRCQSNLMVVEWRGVLSEIWDKGLDFPLSSWLLSVRQLW